MNDPSWTASMSSTILKYLSTLSLAMSVPIAPIFVSSASSSNLRFLTRSSQDLRLCSAIVLPFIACCRILTRVWSCCISFCCSFGGLSSNDTSMTGLAGVSSCCCPIPARWPFLAQAVAGRLTGMLLLLFRSRDLVEHATRLPLCAVDRGRPPQSS